MLIRDHRPPEEEIAFWRSVREQFYLKDDVTYLQGGTVGPSPRPVIEHVISLLREFESDPLHNQREALLGPIIEEGRKKLAALVGTEPERVALVTNTTMGMNIPVHALPLEAGKEILMSSQEYGSIRAMWEYMAQEKGMRIRNVLLPMLPGSPDEVVDAFAEGIGSRTQVMVFSHVYCSSGLVTPVKALCRLAHDHGALAIVDGAHAIGMVPVDITDFGCDFYTSSCHKWLLAPKGVGMAYIPESLEHSRPATLGFGLKQEGGAARFDVAGTRDLTHFAGLGKAIDFQAEIGWKEKIRPYCLGLAAYLKRRVLEQFSTARLTIPTDPEQSGFMTTFTIPGIDHGKAAERLWREYRIESVSVNVGETPAFRISTHLYNSHDDIDRFVSSLAEILAT